MSDTALIISGAQVVSVSATREDEAALQQEMDATNEQLNADLFQIG